MTTAVDDQKTTDDEQGDSPVLPDQGDDAPEQETDARLLKDDGSPYTKADIEALQGALKKARRDARDARRGKPETEGDGDGEDAVKAAEQAQASKWKPLIVKTAARALFTEAGLTAEGDAMTRVLRMLDLDDLDVDDEGQVDGLREQVEDIRTDFPQLFATARVRGPRADVGDKGNGAPAKKRDAAEEIVARLRGGAA